MREIRKFKITVHRKKFKTNVGRAFFPSNTIKIPVIKDLMSIHVILHEIGHIIKNHDKRNIPLYIEEFEAEEFALSILRKWNIHKLFPKDYKKIRFEAVKYLMWNILSDIGAGIKLKNIRHRVLKFCNIMPITLRKLSL